MQANYSISNECGRQRPEIELAYVEWDDAVATNHVVAQILEDLGYDVTLTPLDNAIMWEAVSTGATDAMLSAWLPGTRCANGRIQ